MIRLDGLEKVTGQAVYAGDLVLPGMLVGRLLLSPLPHAVIAAIDTTRALSLAGVKAILTGSDMPDIRFGQTVCDETALACGKVRYQGEPVAAVAAVDEETALMALERIRVEYQELPAVYDPEAALAAGAPLVHPELDSYQLLMPVKVSGNSCCQARMQRGDVERAMSESYLVAEDTYQLPMAHQLAIEPRATLARVEGGRLTVWSSTQAAFNVRSGIARALQLPLERVRVITTRVGGAFGSKAGARLEPICAALALRTGRPVQMVASRQDEFYLTNPRHPVRIQLQTGVSREGKILGRRAQIVMDSGAYATFGPQAASQCGIMAVGPYYVPNIDVEALCVYTNKIAGGACRAPGAPQAHFAGETQLDYLAQQLGMDPIDLRLSNALQDGQPTASGQIVQHSGYTRVLQALRQALPPRSHDAGGIRRRGLGIAGLMWGMGGGSSGAQLKLNEDGSVVLLTGAGETGAGSETALAAIVAAELEIALERVRVVGGDTDTTPYDAGAVGSRTTHTMGQAVVAAARALRNQVQAGIAKYWQVEPDQVEFQAGRLLLRGEDSRQLTLAAAAAVLNASQGPLVGNGSYFAATPPHDPEVTSGSARPAKVLYVFGAQAAEVEVDIQTGEVQVLEVVAVHHLGRALYPQGVSGQIQGGIVQGLGFALTEEMVFNDGQLLNADLANYRLLTAADAPRIREVILDDEKDPIWRGIGEPPVIGVAAAIANAVRDALGLKIQRLPIHPEALWWACQRKNSEPIFPD